jgi:hypothetical protein
MLPVTIRVDQKWVDELIKKLDKYEMFKDRSQKVWEWVQTTGEREKSPIKKPKKVAEAVDDKVVKVKPKKEKSPIKKPKKVAEAKAKKVTFAVEEKVKPKKVTVSRTTTQCLKVESLRKETKDKTMTLEKWISDPKNVYVGRKGRIFIGSGEEKKIFHYKSSKFANPYKVGKKEGEYTIEKAIKLYKTHLSDSGLVEVAKKELKGKNLGCFCDQKGPCHAKVLAEIANE